MWEKEREEKEMEKTIEKRDNDLNDVDLKPKYTPPPPSQRDLFLKESEEEQRICTVQCIIPLAITRISGGREGRKRARVGENLIPFFVK